MFYNYCYDINILGYKTIITAFDENFKRCEKLNTRSSTTTRSNRQDYSKYCLGANKLLELKMMLHIIDVSSLTCPKRFVNHKQEIECNRDAWGYHPILSGITYIIYSINSIYYIYTIYMICIYTIYMVCICNIYYVYVLYILCMYYIYYVCIIYKMYI